MNETKSLKHHLFNINGDFNLKRKSLKYQLFNIKGYFNDLTPPRKLH